VARVTRLGNFFQIGQLLETHFDCFEKMKYPKEMAMFWATLTLITVLKFKKLWLHFEKNWAFFFQIFWSP
jgi:hypothetical protein